MIDLSRRRNRGSALAAKMCATGVCLRSPLALPLPSPRGCYASKVLRRNLDSALAANMCATVVFLLGTFALPLPSPGGRHQVKATLRLETARWSESKAC